MVKIPTSIASLVPQTPPTFKKGDEIKLHIGGQETKEGWLIFSAENQPFVDVTGNCNDLSAFGDESCSDIYCSHVVEHLSMVGEVDQTIREFFRVLSPGGVLRIAVPDIAVLFRFYLKPETDMKSRVQLLRFIFGGQKDAFDFHKCGFDAEILGATLAAIGFTEIEQVKSFGLFQDSSQLSIDGIPMSLNMIARKPT